MNKHSKKTLSKKGTPAVSAEPPKHNFNTYLYSNSLFTEGVIALGEV